MTRKKHHYPKTRKPRKTNYSITYKLIQEFGEAELYKIWCDCNGMYGAAEFLSAKTGIWITPWIVRHLSNKFNWKRPLQNKKHPLYKAVMINKTKDKDFYKHLEFVEDNSDE
ncbi:MAG: hypothetical protein M5R37_09690 [Melioribacteraceae bacterium]|nr:hypothetical protein [Melioribacteraceae bacterium]